MSGTKDTNDIRRMEGHKPVPAGFLVLFFALIGWGAWYLWSYTPGLSGWSAYKEFSEQEKGASPAASPGGNPFAGNGGAAEEGEEIFEKECAGCHGEHMKDPAGGPDLRGALSFGAGEQALFESVAKGRPGGMPEFGASLGTERIWKVVSYMSRERGGK